MKNKWNLFNDQANWKSLVNISRCRRLAPSQLLLCVLTSLCNLLGEQPSWVSRALKNGWPFMICALFVVAAGVCLFSHPLYSFLNLCCGFQFHTSFVLARFIIVLRWFLPSYCPVPCADTLVLMAFIIFSLHVDFCAAISQEKALFLAPVPVAVVYLVVPFRFPSESLSPS